VSRDAQRAGDVIAHARALVKKSDGEKSLVAVDQMIRGVLSLVQPEVAKHSVVVEEALADARPEPDHERDRCDGEGDVASPGCSSPASVVKESTAPARADPLSAGSGDEQPAALSP